MDGKIEGREGGKLKVDQVETISSFPLDIVL